LFELVLRIGFSLLVVMLLMWAAARLVRRPLSASRAHGALAVLNRQQLTRGAAVTVVRVADRAMILGVTDAQVSLLGEADIADFEAPAHEHRDVVELEPDDPSGELPGLHPAAHPPPRLDKSLLSPRTWTTTLDFLRDRTARR
jgi:flagellar protein FliO/FliZ